MEVFAFFFQIFKFDVRLPHNILSIVYCCPYDHYHSLIFYALQMVHWGENFAELLVVELLLS